MRVHDASSPTIKSPVRSLYSAQDTLLQAEECHNIAPNYRSRSWKRTGEDGLAPVINDRIDGLRQSSFESGVVSSKRRKATKEWEIGGQKSLGLVTSHFLELLRFPDEKMKGIISFYMFLPNSFKTNSKSKLHKTDYCFDHFLFFCFVLLIVFIQRGFLIALTLCSRPIFPALFQTYRTWAVKKSVKITW